MSVRTFKQPTILLAIFGKFCHSTFQITSNHKNKNSKPSSKKRTTLLSFPQSLILRLFTSFSFWEDMFLWRNWINIYGCSGHLSLSLRDICPSTFVKKRNTIFLNDKKIIKNQDIRHYSCKNAWNFVDLAGFEPAASSVRLKRAPNCATGPLMYQNCILGGMHCQVE